MAMKKMQKGGKVTKALPKAQKGMAAKKTAEPKFTPPNNKPTQDSTKYYSDKADYYKKAGFELAGKKDFSDQSQKAYEISGQARKDQLRQMRKSMPGYDNNGFPAKYKTGGMVNSNAKVSASKVAKGRPAKSAEPKSASKVATGRVGGTSKAPRAAAPKMKMGGSMKKKSC